MSGATPGPVIRSAGEADLSALAAIEAASFAIGAWSRDQLAGELARAGGVLLLAPPAGGLAIGWSLAGEGEVLRLAVTPSARRRGLGRRLLAALEDALRVGGAERILLEVRADNAPALTLYRSHGYREVGRRPRYYADGCDALVLSLSE